MLQSLWKKTLLKSFLSAAERQTYREGSMQQLFSASTTEDKTQNDTASMTDSRQNEAPPQRKTNKKHNGQ